MQELGAEMGKAVDMPILRDDFESKVFTFAHIARRIKDGTTTPVEFDNKIRPYVDLLIQGLGIEIGYNCDLCNDLGYTITPAHQSGGNIVDEVEHPCICKASGDIEIDQYE